LVTDPSSFEAVVAADESIRDGYMKHDEFGVD